MHSAAAIVTSGFSFSGSWSPFPPGTDAAYSRTCLLSGPVPDARGIAGTPPARIDLPGGPVTSWSLPFCNNQAGAHGAARRARPVSGGARPVERAPLRRAPFGDDHAVPDSTPDVISWHTGQCSGGTGRIFDVRSV